MAAAVQPQRDRYRPVQKITVMADDQHRALIIANHFLQQIKRFQIKVVGRLVEHQQVGWPRKFARQQQPGSLPA